MLLWQRHTHAIGAITIAQRKHLTFLSQVGDLTCLTLEFLGLSVKPTNRRKIFFWGMTREAPLTLCISQRLVR